MQGPPSSPRDQGVVVIEVERYVTGTTSSQQDISKDIYPHRGIPQRTPLCTNTKTPTKLDSLMTECMKNWTTTLHLNNANGSLT